MRRMTKLTLPQKPARLSKITRFETAAKLQGFSKIAGVDEAGRGPLAGPVVAAACILPEGFYLPKINDSKMLSPEEREKMFLKLTTHPDISFGVGVIEAFIIDQVNILQATLQAMAAAILCLREAPDFVLVDGNQAPPISMPCQLIVKGDTLSQSIMAAAIIAKVTRDRKMVEYDKEWPQYGFASHKGYSTPEHLAALKEWGPCPLHRQSFEPVKKCQEIPCEEV